MNSRNLALVLATFGAAACGDLGTGSTPFLSRLILSGRVTLGGQALDSVGVRFESGARCGGGFISAVDPCSSGFTTTDPDGRYSIAETVLRFSHCSGHIELRYPDTAPWKRIDSYVGCGPHTIDHDFPPDTSQ